jgi:hypothetical protein
MTATEEIEILVAALQKSRINRGWIVVSDIERVPYATGHYAIYDGVEPRGAGITWNMRTSIESAGWFGSCEKPIYMYLPDKDGSAAKYLTEAGFR